MGSNASTGGGGGGVGPAGITKKGTYGTVQEAKKVSSRNELTTAIKEFEPLPVKIIKAVVEGQKKSKQNVLDYEGQAAGVTPMRSPMIIERGGDGGNNGGAIATSGQVVQAPTVTAPTTAEVSQSAAADAAEDNILLRKRRAKAVGRSPTIMTGVTGATGSLTLGKPSLLGR